MRIKYLFFQLYSDKTMQVGIYKMYVILQQNVYTTSMFSILLCSHNTVLHITVHRLIEVPGHNTP